MSKINIATSIKKYIPYVNNLIKNEIGKSIDQLENEILKPYENVSVMTELPDNGWSKEEILDRLDKLNRLDRLYSYTLVLLHSVGVGGRGGSH